MALVRALELNSLLNLRNDSANLSGLCEYVNSAQHTSVSLSALIVCVSPSYI